MIIEEAGPRRRLKLEFLSELERKESQLLSWGVVDGFFPEAELLEIIGRFLGTSDDEGLFDDEFELLDELREDRFLFELPETLGAAAEEPRYRTRMAEGIRLLFRLRQILHWRSWDKAQNLVADYRLLLRARKYPRRHLGREAVQEALSPVLRLVNLERQVVDSLIGGSAPFLLADFQLNASIRVLRELARGRRSGTIVCAGTGSGKTLAFYLPAIVALARWCNKDRWTRCLSLYPRNELLKDQFSDAVRNIRQVNEVLVANGRRALRVGAMYGAVPKASGRPGKGFEQWESLGGRGPRCPYLTCPSCNESDMCWMNEDREAGREVLKCPQCEALVGPEVLVLTREAMLASPPDLLFTSLEMVNQRMSDPKLGRLLGLGQPENRRPRLLLLDEVHTYEGTYGAQAALLIRRWKRLSQAKPHFVGLSATLADARRFFAEFVDEPEALVEEISPRGQELVAEGQEYMLAVRGDPISNTNLLSASIQVSMLLRRILDAGHEVALGEEGVYGTKVFGFTDNLDVVNRLFHDLLDAEGWRLDFDGRPSPKPANPASSAITEPWLAAYRAVNRPDYSIRWPLGQSWDLCDRIGHRLTGNIPPVLVGRTSSQDSGVDTRAEIVVATSSLEVGYDDSSVGAVVQHKAPHSSATFIQRKGRAGRRRQMRPWTVVVLSCFGRDRLAYEGYEQLFDPELQPRHLPVSNRSVLRIQAAYALMDWLSTTGVNRHIWLLLSQPPLPGPFESDSRTQQGKIKEIVEHLLTDEAEQSRFRAYLRQALSLDDATVGSLMWDPPRSLMMSVLPTIIRRLDREWRLAVPLGQNAVRERYRFWSPLPEFVPSNLFSDLNLPEVQIILENIDEPQSMGVRQALQEFSPGRVSLRFGIASRYDRYWIPVKRGQTELMLDDICPEEAREELGMWAQNDGEKIRVVRPYALLVEQPPGEVRSSSNARLKWATQVRPSQEPTTMRLPKGSPWDGVINCLDFHLHAQGSPVEVRRFALGADFTVKVAGEEDLEGFVSFADSIDGAENRQPVALGFAADTDGVRLAIVAPGHVHRRLEADPGLLRSTRRALFRYKITNHPELMAVSNVFQREWLARVYLGSVVLHAERTGTSLEESHREILDRRLDPTHEVLEVIFRSLGDEGPGDPGTRRAELERIIRHINFRVALEDSASSLWEAPNETWEPWLVRRYVSTLTAAIREAIQRLCPEMDADQLCPDIGFGVQEGTDPEEIEVWLTETTVGGGGVVEAFYRGYTEDPRRFFELLESALSPTDLEDVHFELELLLEWLEENSERGETLRNSVAAVRASNSHREQLDSHLEFRKFLSRCGFRTSHPVMTALQARVLRPGSSPRTDGLQAALLRRWQQTEERLGIEVDGHVFAYLSSHNEELDQALSELSVELGPTDRTQWRFDTLYSLFWPRGGPLRSQGLQCYNPYNFLPETDRLLVTSTADRKRREVALGSPQWELFLRSILAEEGVVVLTAPLEQRRELAAAIPALLVAPVDLGFIMGFPRVQALLQDGQRLSVVLEIPEVTQ